MEEYFQMPRRLKNLYIGAELAENENPVCWDAMYFRVMTRPTT